MNQKEKRKSNINCIKYTTNELYKREGLILGLEEASRDPYSFFGLY